MDQNLLYDREEEMRAAMSAVLQGLHVAIPVRVMKDSDGKTVSLQATVRARQTMPDGTVQEVEYPPLDGLVRFSSGGGVTHTHPVKEGDEGMAILSSLSIHNWRELGGTQSQVDGRRHDLSDAMYISGLRSKPRDLQNISTEASEMRSDDGKHVSSLNPTTGTISHSVDGGKHVTTVSKDNGITHSADNGKHVVSLTQNGISMKTARNLAIQAASGLDLKGALSVDGKLSSTQPFASVTGFTGIAHAIVGGLIGAGLMLMAQSWQAPRDAGQLVRYVPASLSVRPVADPS